MMETKVLSATKEVIIGDNKPTVLIGERINPAGKKQLAATLKVYRGKPIINSVTGEEHSLAKVLPLVKKYKAAVIGLTQDNEGIPENPERRVAIAYKIVERAEAEGIPREDVIIDCLAYVRHF